MIHAYIGPSAKSNMKKLTLLCSHVFSGSTALYEAMIGNPRVQGSKTDRVSVYETGVDLLRAVSEPHKIGNRAGVYVDELLFNYQVSTKLVYENCSFVFVVRPPRAVLEHMVGTLRHTPDSAARSYLFRLRRLCEMSKRTGGGILLTWDDLQAGRGLGLIEESMNLKHPIEMQPERLGPYLPLANPQPLGHEVVRECEEGFERYLYFLRNQSLRTPG